MRRTAFLRALRSLVLPRRHKPAPSPSSPGVRLSLERLEDRVALSSGSTGGGSAVPGTSYPETTAHETFVWYLINELRDDPEKVLGHLQQLTRTGQNSGAPVYEKDLW